MHLGEKDQNKHAPVVQALEMVMEGCGPVFAKCADEELRDLVFASLYHPNRFVRETGYRCLAVLCRISAGDALHGFGPRAATCLQDGLSENWSQARIFHNLVITLIGEIAWRTI